jgi:hypothetical protein
MLRRPVSLQRIHSVLKFRCRFRNTDLFFFTAKAYFFLDLRLSPWNEYRFLVLGFGTVCKVNFLTTFREPLWVPSAMIIERYDHCRWDPQRLSKRRRQTYLTHRAKPQNQKSVKLILLPQRPAVSSLLYPMSKTTFLLTCAPLWCHRRRCYYYYY